MEDKKFVCEDCGSESTGPSTCHDKARNCVNCKHPHKEDGSCDCGCK